MPLSPTWQEIGLRLILTIIAGVVVGLDRGARGHAAGLRTTILVALAASVAMIQANVLLAVGGKQQSSFGVMDLMRLPLGILTGIGFIGGGAILRRGDLVTGVTTAATLWVMTVIGLCFGGGQVELGGIATLLTLLTLRAIRWIDVRIPREHHAELAIAVTPDLASVRELVALVTPLGYEARFRRQTGSDDKLHSTLWFEISWKSPDVAGPSLDLMKLVNDHYTVASLEVTSEGSHEP
jgi:putative Mg2+ transporter-C (MgtC) family protein